LLGEAVHGREDRRFIASPKPSERAPKKRPLRLAPEGQK
jgi:hypothetical protein